MSNISKTPVKIREYKLPPTRKPNKNFKRVDFRVLNKNIDVTKMPEKIVKYDTSYLGTEKDLKSFTAR